MSNYNNPARALVVGDSFISAVDMGANLRLNTPSWSVWCCVLPRESMWFRAVVDDFGNLVKVPS